MPVNHRYFRTSALLLVVMAAAGLAPPAAFAQTAELRGTVVDDTGSALPGVAVSIVHSGTGVERTVVTDDAGRRSGRRRCSPVPTWSSRPSWGSAPTPARWSSRSARSPTCASRWRSARSRKASRWSAAAATVEIETTKSDLSAVVNQEQLSELPVLNRGFVGLAQLLPGGGPARSGDGRFGIATSFGGTNVRSMYSMQIDGGVMDHPIYGFAIVNVSQDAVQEFRVLRNQFDSEYSRAGTAVVNVVTRSGTNDLSGRVSYFGRDDSLNAKNAFATTKPPFDSTRFSAAAGRTARAQQGVPLRHAGIQPPELGAHHRAAGRQPVRRRVTTASTTTGTRAKLVQAKADYTANTRHALSVALPLRQRRHRRGLRAGGEHRPRLPGRLRQLELDARPVDAEQRHRPVHGPGHPALPDHDRHAGDPSVVHLGPFAQPAAGLPAPALHLQRHLLLVDRPPRHQVRRPHGDGGPRLPRRLLRRRRVAVQHRPGVQPGRPDHVADPVHAGQRPGDAGTTRTSSGASSPRTTCGWATSRSTSGCATTSTATCAAPT